MSRDFDDINKKIDKKHQELHTQNGSDYSPDKILKEISEIKKEVKDISSKIDTMLEILNSFSIMLIEDDEDLEDNYEDDDDEESWIPEQNEDWNTYEDDE